MTSAVPKTVLLLGATGETGRHALLQALASPSITSVHSFGRRPPSIPTDTAGFSKLHHAELNFDNLLANDATETRKVQDVNADAVVICLGTTRAAAGGMEQFVKIDREYVLAAAKAGRVPGKEQRLVYCSANGASSSSLIPYSTSKGLTEEGLAALGYETIIFRPGMLNVPGGRAEHRLLESIAMKVTGVLSMVSSAIQIETPVLGAAMIRAVEDGKWGLAKASLGKEELLAGSQAWVVSNKDAGLLGATRA